MEYTQPERIELGIENLRRLMVQTLDLIQKEEKENKNIKEFDNFYEGYLFGLNVILKIINKKDTPNLEELKVKIEEGIKSISEEKTKTKQNV